ncbi:MAG: sulfatase [Armatimonadota bacterium]
MKVIYLMADTFRRDHLGVYGNKWVHTPNLDQLAAGAAVFDRAYIGSFPTVPNRRDTLLGRGDQGVPFNRWKVIEPNEVTLPQRLGEKKIPSMLITDTQNNVTRGLNLFKGYTAWYLNRGQEADPYWLDENVPLRYPVPRHLIRYTAGVWHQVLINRAHRRVETDWFAPGTYSKAIEWLERNYRRDDFFLWVDTFDPHEPWDPPQHYIDLYDPGYEGRVFEAPTYGLRKKLGITDRELKHIRARYAAEVTMVDTWIGEFLRTLERLGIFEETLIIFTSDHGTMFDYPGENGRLQKPTTVGADGMCMSAGRPMKEPVRDFPIAESVARIPLIIKLPRMRRGKRVSHIVQPWDLTATILGAFGIRKPAGLIGQSLLPMVRGKGKRIRDAAIVGTNHLAQAMNARWRFSMWRTGKKPMLTDLRNDPSAGRNVLAKNEGVAKRLYRQIVRFMEGMGMDQEYIRGYTLNPEGSKPRSNWFGELYPLGDE